VVHSLGVVLNVPMALRLPRQPLLLVAAQCLTSCMLRPYPSVADHALYLALLPLLQSQLRHMQSGLLLALSFLCMAVLEPAMWQAWIQAESANANFYYSITLLLGGWQALLLVMLLRAGLQVDRQARAVAGVQM
jgi:phosphatidylinositol glycan class U